MGPGGRGPALMSRRPWTAVPEGGILRVMTNHTPPAGSASGASGSASGASGSASGASGSASGASGSASGAAKPTGPGTLITVAPTGAEAQKSAVPALPVTLDELVTTAKECQAAGAAVIHVHIRDDQAQPTLDLARLTDTVAALRESTDLIVQLSTGGAVTDGFEARLAALDA